MGSRPGLNDFQLTTHASHRVAWTGRLEPAAQRLARADGRRRDGSKHDIQGELRSRLCRRNAVCGAEIPPAPLADSGASASSDPSNTRRSAYGTERGRVAPANITSSRCTSWRKKPAGGTCSSNRAVSRLLSSIAGSLRSALPRAWRSCVARAWGVAPFPGDATESARRRNSALMGGRSPPFNACGLRVHQQLFPVSVGIDVDHRSGQSGQVERGLQVQALKASLRSAAWP
jgi:hypothetical protein